MRPSRIKAKLLRHEPVLITALHFMDPAVYEMTSLLGFDGLWLDLEHHGVSVETASQLMRAARVGVSDIVARPAKGEFMRMARLLEAGAQGIMYPRCDNADEARELVRWSRFPPVGSRGFDGGNGDMPYCMMDMASYIEEANRETFLIAQLEDNNSVQNVMDIAAVPGIDVLFFGVGDFSVSNGIAGQWNHPRIWEAIDAVAAAAKRHGKSWGTPSFSPAHAERLMNMGATFLAHTSDIIILKQGLENMKKDFGEVGFSFGKQHADSAQNNGYAAPSRIAD